MDDENAAVARRPEDIVKTHMRMPARFLRPCACKRLRSEKVLETSWGLPNAFKCIIIVFYKLGKNDVNSCNLSSPPWIHDGSTEDSWTFQLHEELIWDTCSATIIFAVSLSGEVVGISVASKKLKGTARAGRHIEVPLNGKNKGKRRCKKIVMYHLVLVDGLQAVPESAGRWHVKAKTDFHHP